MLVTVAFKVGLGVCDMRDARRGALWIGGEVREARHLVNAVETARVQDFCLFSKEVADTDQQVGVGETYDLAAAAAGGDGLCGGGADDGDRLDGVLIQRQSIVLVLEEDCSFESSL